MRWFKHDTDANQDARLQNVMLDYGLEGYGLYWYCIELIAGRIDKDNLTFELEHDARIIARNVGSTAQKVEEMMRYFVKLGLFEDSDGVITCMKLAKRLDTSMTGNPTMRKLIEMVKKTASNNDKDEQKHDQTEHSHDSVMLDKIRLDKNKLHTECAASIDASVFDQIWQMYPKRQGSNPKAAAGKKYQAMLRKGYTAEQLAIAVKTYAGIITRDRIAPQFVKQASTFFGPGGHVDDMLRIHVEDQAKKQALQEKYITAVTAEKSNSDAAKAQAKSLRELL